MKKIYTIVSAVFLLFLTNCDLKDELNNLVTFTINQSVEFEIPSSSVVDLPIDIETPEVESSTTSSFENNNTRADLVERITLTSLELQITDPQDRDFSFLKSIEVYISNDNLGETLLADNQDIPETVGQELTLNTSGENVRPYLLEDTYDIITKVVTRETANSRTEINADLSFEVQATSF